MGLRCSGFDGVGGSTNTMSASNETHGDFSRVFRFSPELRLDEALEDEVGTITDDEEDGAEHCRV